MDSHVWIHLIKVSHVHIADVMNFLNVLPRSIWMLWVLANKHCTDEIVNSSLYVGPEFLLLTKLSKRSDSLSILFK